MRISVIIPMRNEIHNLDRVLSMVNSQDTLPDEVVIADGRSTDGTTEALAKAVGSWPWLRVVDNPARIVPGGLNAALLATTGDVVVRMDAHAHYPENYISEVVTCLSDHPQAAGVGGAMITKGRSPWGDAIAAVLARPMGMGGAKHRVSTVEGPAEHVFSGCYRRGALIDIGGWDTRYSANEDYEADARLRECGWDIWLTPQVRPIWFTRDTWPGLVRQMWRYGGGKALTLLEHPRTTRLRQLVPVALVVGLPTLIVVWPVVGLGALGLYLAASATMGVVAARHDGAPLLRTAVVPATIHLVWGAGCAVGLVRHLFSRRVGKPAAINQRHGDAAPQGSSSE